MTARKPKEQHKKDGKPTAYKPEYAALAAKLCTHGLTDFEIAKVLGVTERCIYLWKGRHPEFVQALKVGKAAADDRVERSLYHKALGYTYEDKDGNEVRVPPDTTAMIFWLKNRRKEQWRDVHNHEVRVATEYAQLSDEELVARMQASAKLLLEAPKVIEHDEDGEQS